MEDFNRVEDVIKRHPHAETMYRLNFCDIEKYLKKIEAEEAKKFIEIKNLPMDLTSMEDTIRFRCYNNDILDVMIKNKKIQIETLNKKLSFINDYKKYLNKYDLETCERHENMLKNFVSYRIDEAEFLTELYKKY